MPAVIGTAAEAAMKTDAAMTEQLLAQAIVAKPQDRLLVERGFDWLRARSSQEDALAWLEKLQESVGRPLRSLLITLAAHRGGASVRARFDQLLGEAVMETPFAEIVRVREALCALEEPDPADAALVLDDRSQALEIFFRFLTPEPRQMPLIRTPAQVRQALEADGIKFNELSSFLEGFLRASPEWQEVMEASSITAPPARESYLQAEAESGFLDRLALTGTLPMMDPFTGEIVHPFDSFVAFGRSVYSYRGKHLFYLICGKPWSGALGLYIPALNLSLAFARTGSSLLGADLANVVAVIMRRACQRVVAGETVWPKADDRPRRVILSIGNTENFAHHIWNFYSAIERMARTGLTSRLSGAVFSGTEFFGPLDELFPELKAAGYTRTRKQNVIDPAPFSLDSMVMQSGGFFAAASLSQRIIDHMRSLPKAPARHPDTPVLEPADVPRVAGAPVIWLAFRLRDKAWTEQEAGSVRIIQILAERFPNALFLLDGFSFPVGHDQISSQWTDVITALKAMGDRIAVASGRPKQVVNMVGNTLRESVLWAQETSVYLAPYGTTQHKIGWFTKAPGLVYVPPTFSPGIAARSPACAVADYGPSPHFIFADAASAGERRGFNRNRERFFNVALDADSMADQLTELLNTGTLRDDEARSSQVQ
ncbi:hypothetical protein [Roseococcus sp. YIM B11640]|uniref:hypothetical protein n=1 Tax=Roseococcus sp. YIM B11640 TaxID=3133973 RepID=UPI003C7D26E2